jgi:hypothetical protein
MKEMKKEIKNDSKQENKNENSERYGKNDKQRKKEQKFATVREALEGIDEELIKKYKNLGASCWRCGRSNHFTLECDAKSTETGVSIGKPAISSQQKRNVEEEDNVEENKRATTASTRVDEVAQQKQIWEVDTDTEEDF